MRTIEQILSQIKRMKEITADTPAGRGRMEALEVLEEYINPPGKCCHVYGYGPPHGGVVRIYYEPLQSDELAWQRNKFCPNYGENLHLLAGR